ncbi:hypothetical protein AUJ61_02340 [Candidatus Pacearchaeota archaeon CG1_02_30_18]|nr:MAG: hypothetical protein AUJ61_02340 [Candidatus Pacearchaeota archaeon CG1_02_30_18]
MKENIYKMKGFEYFPILGGKKYDQRIEKHIKSNGRPKSEEEFLQYIEGLRNRIFYQMIVGIPSIALGSFVIGEGLEALLK